MALINGKKVEIHLKGGFSERKGIKHFSDIVQVNSLNERTRNKLYTATEEIFGLMDKYNERLQNCFIEFIYEELFSLTKRDIPKIYGYSDYSHTSVFNEIYNIINTEDYSNILTFIEGVIKDFSIIDQDTGNMLNLESRYTNIINDIFQKENVNYRIVDGIVTDLLNEETIKEIEETLENPYTVVTTHYSKALELLYKAKDYDNSIKESISSVESICQILTGNDKATLGDALKLLKDKIHPAMKSAFEKLYGYTSDANGIRHSNGLGEGNSTFEEAKYMLISCSAFVNYLKENFEEGK
ncbi:MAG: AbiJ-NTD4 domain-containing protein [Clostridia bacterium]